MEANKHQVLRQYAKYVFLDVVKFSERSAEAQSEIVRQLNEIVCQSLEVNGVNNDDCILIPTGDGMCIALINYNLRYDLHIQVALNILIFLDNYNKATKDECRQFQVRIGINQNTDILVTDINKRKNIAGAGINMASRIMDKADGGQILVSQTVYDELQPSEHYMNKFADYTALGKHNRTFRVYQYCLDCSPGLNTEIPNEFFKEQINEQISETKLNKITALYFAHAIRLKKFLIEKQGSGSEDFSLVVLLWFLATDSLGKLEATEIDPYEPRIYGRGTLSLDSVFQYYKSLDHWILIKLTDFILHELSKYESYLSTAKFTYVRIFVNDKGKQKLKREWPEIWNELDLDNVA